jgi:putative SOS response-associated peptidase YedK
MSGQLCLVPMVAFYEPNWETGKNQWWRIHLASGEPFAVAGIWQSWDLDTDNPRYSFSQLTVNSDDHPFMKRFHKPGDEKRSLVVVAREDYDNWLDCRSPEIARTFLQVPPPGLLIGEPRPVPPRTPKTKGELF